MCDTLVAVPPATADGAVWFGKNSDREPSEAQVVEQVPAGGGGGKVRCSNLEVPQAAKTHAVLLSRPTWMWGCEMGANERGVVAGNEAVFTRLPVEKTGLSGMDLMRLALERGGTAAEAAEVVIEHLSRYPQGGGMGFRNRSFGYHSSFIFADAREAWVLETAGRFWVLERVVGVRTISNALSIGERFDRAHPEAADEARRRGWLKPGEAFDFARCFSDTLYSQLAGGRVRQQCTAQSLLQGSVDRTRMMSALRNHGGQSPGAGLRMLVPCAHASYLPTRNSGQTTSSMVSRLDANGASHWLTGTSAPCLSVFKPASVTGGQLGPPPTAAFDGVSLWWRHERLHRRALGDYARAHATLEADRAALEARALAGQCVDPWNEHRELVPEWTQRLATWHGMSPYSWWWHKQSAMDRLPA